MSRYWQNVTIILTLLRYTAKKCNALRYKLLKIVISLQ